jgi:hypothetical protein
LLTTINFSNFYFKKRKKCQMSIRNTIQRHLKANFVVFYKKWEEWENKGTKMCAGKRRTSLGINLSHCQLPCMQFS